MNMKMVVKLRWICENVDDLFKGVAMSGRVKDQRVGTKYAEYQGRAEKQYPMFLAGADQKYPIFALL
jgi:hypothetical protein